MYKIVEEDELRVKSAFITVGFKVNKMRRLPNRYLGIGGGMNDARWMAERPSWLVYTDVGTIDIGPRKRVMEIDWSDTEIRGLVTEDNVTKSETLVHAWKWEKVIEYLFALRKLATYLQI